MALWVLPSQSPSQCGNFHCLIMKPFPFPPKPYQWHFLHFAIRVLLLVTICGSFLPLASLRLGCVLKRCLFPLSHLPSHTTRLSLVRLAFPHHQLSIIVDLLLCVVSSQLLVGVRSWPNARQPTSSLLSFHLILPNMSIIYHNLLPVFCCSTISALISCQISLKS